MDVTPCGACGSGDIECVDSGSWCQAVCQVCGAFAQAVRYSGEYAAREEAVKKWNELQAGQTEGLC